MLIQVIKLSLGATFAILTAASFGLNNPLTAGTVVLLCLGKTRKSSLESTLTRAKSLTIALLLSGTIFTTFGFSVHTFCLFLVLFVPIVYRLKLETGLVIGVVLSGHFLARGVIDQTVIINTISLFLIGALTAFVANLYVPNLNKRIVEKQREIEQLFTEILLQTATTLRGDLNFSDTVFIRAEKVIANALITAKIDDENHLINDRSYFVDYINFRQMQFEILRRLSDLAIKIDIEIVQVELIADLTVDIANSISEFGSGKQVISQINEISSGFKKMPLPATREEFENRAILFQFLNEIRYLVELKRFFRAEHRTNK